MFLSLKLNIMASKKTNTSKVSNVETALNHIQMTGLVTYDQWMEKDTVKSSFYFSPDNPAPKQVETFRSEGVGQQMSDGTFEFIRRKRVRSEAKLIKKLAHGRLSLNKDGAYRLTLTFEPGEDCVICEEMCGEAFCAAEVIKYRKMS